MCPLNLLLYLCPRGALYYYANIFILLKMIGLAFAMYFYLRKYKIPSIVPILGSVLYAFGAASLVHFQIMLVMDAAFFLPLLMIGLDRLMEKKKSRFFIIVLAWAMISNVYTGAILCIFLFFTSGLRIFFGIGRKTFGSKKETVLRLFVAVVAGCLFECGHYNPGIKWHFQYIKNADRRFLQTYQTAVKAAWSETEWKDVQRLVVNMALPLAAILFLLVTGKGAAKEKWKRYRAQILRVILLAVSVIVPGTELLWHGEAAPAGR